MFGLAVSGLLASFDVQTKTRYGGACGSDTSRCKGRYVTGLGKRLVMIAAVKRRQIDGHLRGGLRLILLGESRRWGERQDADD